MFKTTTNFTLPMFKELCTEVYSLIAKNARFTGDPQIRRRHLSKLSVEQRFLNFIWYKKCHSVIIYDSYHWNWSASFVCDDAKFVASCVCVEISNKILEKDGD